MNKTLFLVVFFLAVVLTGCGLYPKTRYDFVLNCTASKFIANNDSVSECMRQADAYEREAGPKAYTSDGPSLFFRWRKEIK
jgi:hypothetical protein